MHPFPISVQFGSKREVIDSSDKTFFHDIVVKRIDTTRIDTTTRHQWNKRPMGHIAQIRNISN